MTILTIKAFLLISGLFSLIFCLPLGGAIVEGYNTIFFLPLSFLVVMPFLTSKLSLKRGASISLWFVVIFSWLRYVLLPMIGILSGYYTDLGLLGTSQSTSMAIMILSIELLFVSFMVYLIINKKSNGRQESNTAPLKLTGNKGAYLTYILLAASMYILFGSRMNPFQFLFIDVSDNVRFGDTTETSGVIVRSITSSGLTFLVLVAVAVSWQKHNLTNKKRYVYLALIFVVFRLLIIAGERRSSQIYLGFAFALLLVKLFPAEKRSILLWIGISAGSVLVSMSIYKFFNAFAYGSYALALSNADIDLRWLAATLDSYFFGLRNVASNIGYAENLTSGRDLISLLQETGRNIFGLHYLFKSGTLTAAQEYNLFIYRGLQSSGHLLSSTGYGYLYGSFLLAPMFTMINIAVMFRMESSIRKAKSIEYYYIFSLIFIRFAFGMYSNSMPLLNYATQLFIVNSVVIFAAKLIKTQVKNKMTFKEVPI